MKLDLNEVVSHLGKHISYEINEPPIEDPESGLKCVEPVRGKATFSNTGRHIVVLGSFATTVEIECARCLGNYRIKSSRSLKRGFSCRAMSRTRMRSEDDEVPDDEAECFSRRTCWI